MIYAKINNEVSSVSYDYKTDDVQDILQLAANPSTTSRTINILIKTLTKAKFRVIPAQGQHPTPLTIGIPQIDLCEKSMGANNYTFQVNDRNKISVHLTPFIDSDPNIHIIGPFVKGNSRKWTSSKVGSDSIVIIPTQEELGGIFTIVVSSQNTSYYTLVVIDEAQTTVFPPQPQHPTQILSGFQIQQQTETGSEYYYILHVPPDLVSDIVVTVSPLYGDVDLYVNRQQNGFYYTNSTSPQSNTAVWSSEQSFGPDSIVINHQDPNYLITGGLYYITVRAISNSQFILRGYSADTIITLTEGTPLIDILSSKSYHYYRFVDKNPLEDIIFDVNPFSGDPDLLVSCSVKPTGDDSGYPSRIFSHFNFSSVRSGEDSILIDKSQRLSKVCPNGIYYLAIFAFSATRVSLIATHQGGAIYLHDGIPVPSSSYANIGRFFRYVMGSELEQLTISLTPDHGDSDLYVSIGKEVSFFRWDYYSVNSGTNIDQIVIPETAMCINCVINILVLSREAATFSIVASLQDTTIQLSNAVPLQESVDYKSIQYYSLHSFENGTAFVVLTVFSGAPELYLSTKTEYPTRHTNNTVVNTLAAIGNLPLASIPIKAGEVLYIGVGGARTNATFTIRAHIRVHDVEPLLSLLEGVPQADSILRYGPQWNFYQINMPPGHESISLRATALVGNIDVYIMRCPYQGSECLGTHNPGSHSYLPNASHYLYTTENLVHDWITIDRVDNHSVSYIAGVLSQSLYVEYHISMTLEDSILMISPGTPLTDQVEEGAYDYFSVYMDETPQQFTIHLTPYSGDGDLYVSTVLHRPNRTHYTWYSAAFGDDNIVIDPELDSRACKGCIYYIAVYGFRPTTYSLNVRTVSTVGRLLDGIPVTDEIGYFSYLRYTFKNTYGIGRSFRVLLTAISGNPAVFVTLDGSVPSLLHHDYSASTWISSSLSISILTSDERYSPCLDADCDIRVAVYGVTSCNYILTLTSSLSSTMLQLNVPLSIEVAANSYDYFTVILSDISATLRLSITEYTGVTIMYVSCRTNFPNTTLSTHEWYHYPSNRNQVGYLDITALDVSDKGCPSNGEFHIGVKGLSSASYSIMATSSQNNTVPRLIVGTNFPGVVEHGHFNYYYYRPNQNYADDLRLQVLVNRGDVDLYIGSSWDNRPHYSTFTNQVMSYIISSTSIGDESILLRHKVIKNICLNRKDDCYIVIGVYGVYESNSLNKSSYSLRMTTVDMTITLSSGIPVRGSLERFEFGYYKYTVTEPNRDVMISVTPMIGDPDMVVSLNPLVHPTLSNYTWMVASWGADVLTIQHADLARYCIPIPSRAKNCDLYIGIYAWQNTTYSVMAQMDEGIAHPVVLADGQPQHSQVNLGAYVYYTFYINGFVNNQIIDGLHVTLTSSDGDQDIYLSFGADTEPGKSQYDYKSTNFGGVSDEIIVSANMDHFCTDCYVNIAVFGFKAGHYSLVVTSKGIVELQSGVAIGGHLNQGQYRYYSIYNTNPTALISFSLTAITGDPDLYVNIFTSNSDSTTSASQYKYPTNSNYLWRSIHAGRDEILIDYSDHLFCVDCVYVVGVYSYRNSSYTLLASTTQDAIITLVPNRPQVVHVRDTTKLKYFKLISQKSAEDLTVSLTNFGSSHCVMYMEKYLISTYNGSLPDPSNPATYSYTTLHSGVESLFAPGPNTEPTLYIVAVRANIPTSYSITMSASSLPVILRSGVPQLNYVQQGSMAQFVFYMSDIEDVQITITALSGDPDLFISEALDPVCKPDPSMYWRIKCANYSWSSTSYSTDQLIISKDLPCSAVMPGTSVRDSCDPSKYGTGPLHIGIYGYQTSRFMIMATIRGEHVTLLPGKPQLSITSPAIVCSSRNPSNGVCLNSATTTKVHAAYFTYSVSNRPTSNGYDLNNNAIYITVKPTCNSSLATGCSPGCDCDPINLYVWSCPASKCTAGDKYPSYYTGHFKGQMQITSTSNSMLISTFTPSLYCNPSIIGGTCIYYIALISKQSKKPITFTIDIQNPDDVSVVTCDETPSPDGYRLSKLITSPQRTSISTPFGSQSCSKYYEICSSSTSNENKDQLIVSVEQCVGSSEIYACSNDACESFLPSEKSWEYYANSMESCSSQSTTGTSTTTSLKPICQPNAGGRISQPYLSLPEKKGNYHIKVNGTGSYYLNIQSTINGEIVQPQFVFDTTVAAASTGLHLISQTATTLTLSWNHIGILMPGESRPKKTINIMYHLYLFDENELISLLMNSQHLSLNLDSKCGLDYISSLITSSKIIAIPAIDIESLSVTHTISDLVKGTRYAIYLLSICDSSCLRQISKSITTTHYITCAGSVNCITQKYYYGSIIAQTSTHGGDEGNSSDSSSMDTFLLIVIICLLALLSFLFGIFSYYYRNKKQLDEIQAFEMVDFNSSTSGSELYDPSDSFHSNTSAGPRTISSKPSPFFGFFGSPYSNQSATSKGPILTSQSPRLGEGMNSDKSGNRSMMSRVKLPNQASLFSNYSPLIREDQEDEEEVTINL